MRVNGDGAGFVAEIAAELGVPLLHLSTDYVFDGTLDRPYREDDADRADRRLWPLQARGREARRRDSARMRRSCARPGSTARSAPISCAPCCGSARRARRSASSPISSAIRPPRSTSPTRCSRSPRRLARDPAPELRGIFHMTGAGEASWADFAEAIFARAAQRGRTARAREPHRDRRLSDARANGRPIRGSTMRSSRACMASRCRMARRRSTSASIVCSTARLTTRIA